jgi:hypothetical protein
MRPGDWLIYYSPTIDMGGDALRAFTAIGQVEGPEVYRCDMGGGFVPYRRNVRYADAEELLLDMIKPKLELCARRNWGMALRRGHLRLEAADFATIAAAMGVRPAKGFGMELE